MKPLSELTQPIGWFCCAGMWVAAGGGQRKGIRFRPKPQSIRVRIPLDGVDLPELLGKTEEQKNHEYFYWIWAVRVGKWKLFPAGQGKYRLYDLENDIAEQHDLADEFPEVVARCSKYFEEAKR